MPDRKTLLLRMALLKNNEKLEREREENLAIIPANPGPPPGPSLPSQTQKENRTKDWVEKLPDPDCVSQFSDDGASSVAQSIDVPDWFSNTISEFGNGKRTKEIGEPSKVGTLTLKNDGIKLIVDALNNNDQPSEKLDNFCFENRGDPLCSFKSLDNNNNGNLTEFENDCGKEPTDSCNMNDLKGTESTNDSDIRKEIAELKQASTESPQVYSTAACPQVEEITPHSLNPMSTENTSTLINEPLILEENNGRTSLSNEDSSSEIDILADSDDELDGCCRTRPFSRKPVNSAQEGCEVIQGEVSPDGTVTFECAQPNITPEESTVLQPVTTMALDASKPANKRAFRSTGKTTTSDHKTTARRKLFSPAKQTVLADSDTAALVSDLENAGVDLTNELLVLPLNDIVEETISPLESDELLHNDEETIAATNQDEEFNPEEQNIPSSDEEPSPKKRIQRKDTWKVSKIKNLRNSGQAYVNSKGKQIEAKVMKGPCQCRYKCYAKINEDQRQKIHNKFWAIGTARGQWDFMSKHVEVIGVKKRTTENKPVRQWTYKYKFKAMDGPHPYVYVCREMFLNTLSVSSQRLRTVFDKLDRKEGIISPDKRGKHAKLTPASKRITANVIEHINQFPRVESHYCRKKTKLKYLDEHLNVRKMHSLYLLGRSGQPDTATLRQYQDIFRKHFSHKLKFFKPKKDQCSKCLVFKSLSPAQKQEKEEDYNEHIKNKTRAREIKEKDIENAEPSVCVCTFDLEKTLYCPKGEDAHFYYLSKLKCYNFTIFQSNVKQGHCYVWDETIAHRGADEFASCLFIFISEKASEGYKEFHFYSDNCSSQNKNKVLFSMYNFASHRFNVVITHRYLEVGHTQMECDSMHALIERRSKNVTVYAPSQWYAIIKAAKLTPPKYQVKEMLQENFLSFSRVTEEHNWSQLPSSKIREIQVCKNEVLYKTAYDGPVITINPIRPRPGRPLNWTTIELQPSNSERLPVPDKVMKGLRGLCEKGSIPATYHQFYYGIPTLPPKPKNTGARKRKKPQNGNENDTVNNEEEGVEEDEDDPGDSNDVEGEVDESEDSESDDGNEEDLNE